MRAMSQASLRVSHTVTSALEFIESLPRGAYTTARTVKGTDRIFELRRHVDRLVNSSRPFLKGSLSDADVKRLTISVIDELMKSSTSLLNESDCKLTVVITIGDEEKGKDINAYAHLEAMKKRDITRPIFVALGGPPRDNAVVKDSKWVRDRKAIVDDAAEDTLLLGKDGTVLLEGAQTNFFAVTSGGVVVTANEGILEGTVRAAVIDACKDLTIPLKLEAPNVGEIDSFSEAFLASTSRLVMPIDILGSKTLPKERPITLKIADWVRKHVEERSIAVRDLDV